VATPIAPPGSLQTSPAVIQPDAKGRQRLVFNKDGYSYWTWQGHKIHYVEYDESGEDTSLHATSHAVNDQEEAKARLRRTPLVLIHGFGASVFHW